MPTYKRLDIPKLLAEIDQDASSQIYLIWGERYLCRNAAQELIDRLLPEEKRQATSLQHIDGDQEDFSKTLNQLKTFSLFSGPQIIWVTDSKLFYSKGVAKNIWNKVCEKKERNEDKQALRYLLQMVHLAGLSPDDLADEDITSLSAARWKNLFGFNKPQSDLSWVSGLLADIPADLSMAKSTDSDAAGMYMQAFEKGIPRNNTLILLAEAVDKRKRLYKYIQEYGIIIDLAVESGGSAAAKKDQEKVIKELIQDTLAKYGKKLAPDTLPVLMERVGFHPVAAVMEAEKLALFAGERKTITGDDIDAIIGRTREEALYELTEAVTSGNLANGLLILAHLHDNGVHGLAVLATLRNHLKKLLLVRSFQELRSPSYNQSLSYQVFQKRYLPQLKEGRDEWSSLLWKNHPYGLYMLFRQAAQFSCEYLQDGLKQVLAAEYRMKSSSVDSRLIMDSLLFNLVRWKIAGESAV
ncbi:MAG: DNA polymerase III subunit delta [Deltaproteobacteria bacterium]|jgi:DNA polymerase-3 subunit delta|nr:DNA polymerase III subunit delta [Deltaproteobacteria bacterium]